eukprot:CAMPEP_0117443052 /NCGR_PEP_ID=MMETSP0759-20121206/4487_1 /TAXON_ID=63605 /ORGANISM="Percolomonas cosmopolitus, Strain WS" /LENGTH=560 /DNA_ID=CAMNT_0005234997 /DNA_START=168 /DNA_END=1850 /DNA_ORIENTATION=+
MTTSATSKNAHKYLASSSAKSSSGVNGGASSSSHHNNSNTHNAPYAHPTLQKYIDSLYHPHTLPTQDLSLLLATDLTYRLKEIVMQAAKFRDFAKRGDEMLQVDDMNQALTLLNMKPTYGYKEGSLQFNQIPLKNIFYIPTRELNIRDELKVPLKDENLGGICVASHWLAVEGVQPKIPQNPLTETVLARERIGKLNRMVAIAEERGLYVPQYEDDSQQGGAHRTKLVKHQLTKEQRLYYEKVTQSMRDQDKPLVRKQSLISLQKDLGLHQLVPYFAQYVADEVAHNLTNLSLLYNLMEMTHALLTNPNIHIELYLHQLIPSILTCIVTERPCISPLQNHWKLRNYAADLIAFLVRKYSASYENLETRISRTLMLALLDKDKPRTSHYGAIVAIKALGPQAVKLFLLEPIESSNLRVFVSTLMPDLKHKDLIVRHEAQMCFSALMECCSVFFAYASQFLKPHPTATSDAPILTSSAKSVGGGKNDQPAQDTNTTDVDGDEKMRDLQLSLKERLASFALLPEEINSRYAELYDIFGDGVLPYIPYDTYPTDDSMLAMNVLL